MRKMVIDLLELPDGEYDSEEEDYALNDHFGEKLSTVYRKEFTPEYRPSIYLHFHYKVECEKIAFMTLEVSMNHHSHQDLDNLRILCCVFFCLDFLLDEERGVVFIKADNLFDMGCFVESLTYKGFDLQHSIAIVEEEENIYEARIKWLRKKEANKRELLEMAKREYWDDEDFLMEKYTELDLLES